ncbi:MAG: 50S ribosomal protein L9 [Amoebophilaceae bacterium]|nr:50S ribosomal protein L9 [Amoebophilaceae bacterium]
MEIILTNAYKKLGKKGDTVAVKPGYARNYLIPKGLAILASKANKKIVVENNRQAAAKKLKLKENAQHLLPILADCKIVLMAKVGKEDKIFGSITPLQISKSLKEKNILVDYTKIHLVNPVKTLGVHQAELILHEEVSYLLNFQVIAS